LRMREERAESERAARRAKPARAPRKPAPARQPERPSKNQAARAERLEREIADAEAALAALEQELADPQAWNDPRSAARSSARHAEAKRALEALYARWEAVAG